MQARTKEQWAQLCEQAAVEKDSEKLMTLLDEIIRMLDDKEERLKGQHSQTSIRQGER